MGKGETDRQVERWELRQTSTQSDRQETDLHRQTGRQMKQSAK